MSGNSSFFFQQRYDSFRIIIYECDLSEARYIYQTGYFFINKMCRVKRICESVNICIISRFFMRRFALKSSRSVCSHQKTYIIHTMHLALNRSAVKVSKANLIQFVLLKCPKSGASLALFTLHGFHCSLSAFQLQIRLPSIETV